MKVIEKEIVNKVKKYQSFDGTTFDSEEECKIYENSAVGILLSRLEPHTINDGYEDELFGFGCSEAFTRVIYVDKTETAETINHILAIQGYNKKNYVTEDDGYVFLQTYIVGNVLENAYVFKAKDLFKNIFGDGFTVNIEKNDDTPNPHIKDVSDLNEYE